MSGDGLQGVAEEPVRQVGVLNFRAGRILERRLFHQRPQSAWARHVGEVRRSGQIDVDRQARRIPQHVAQRYVLLAVGGEVRQELGDRVTEADDAPLDEEHVGDRGRKDLGVRLEVEQRVFRHGVFARFLRAHRAVEHDLAVPRDEDDRAGHQTSVDAVLDPGRDVVEPGLRHADACRTAHMKGATALGCDYLQRPGFKVQSCDCGAAQHRAAGLDEASARHASRFGCALVCIHGNPSMPVARTAVC